MKKYVLCALLCLVAVANMHGDGVVGHDYKEPFPLHRAIWNNDVSEVKRLIASGVDINEKDINSNSPLHLAVVSGDIKIVQLLINARADVNMRKNAGATALDLAYLCRAFSAKELLSARNEIVQQLIQTGGLFGQDVFWENIKKRIFDVIRTTSIIIPPVMVTLQFLMGYWIHHRINTDPIFRRATALSLLHERYDPHWLFEPRNLVLGYLGKNID